MNGKSLATAVILAAGAAMAALIMTIEPPAMADEHEGANTAEFERGPHNGRMLRSGDSAVEMTIYEDGVPPEFRVYGYAKDKPVAASGLSLTVELQRLGGVVDAIEFTPDGEYLRGRQTVYEPHSFDVTVRATIDGKAHSWTYQSHEGRVEISPDAAAAGGVKTETAGAAEIRQVVHASGRIILDPARTARVRPRFPGVLRDLKKALGDRVAKGETIATIESSESLQPYAVKAPIDGVVIAQHAVAGEVVELDPIMEIADLDRVMAELWIFPRDIAAVQAGQEVAITAAGAALSTSGKLGMILSAAEAGSQAVAVRVPIANPDGAWRPGNAIDAEVTTGVRTAPLAVRVAGLQTFRDFTVVYANVGDTYEVRMLELGDGDRTFVEVLGGLAPGTTYVTDGSYLIKADIEKSGASHDH